MANGYPHSLKIFADLRADTLLVSDQAGMWKGHIGGICSGEDDI
jgi:hypothetical protein